MITRRIQIKRIALLLALIYLLLPGFTMIEAVGHAAKHGQTAHHSAQHASSICAWMCASSTFVHSGDQHLNQRFDPSSENLAIYSDQLFSNLLIIAYFIRSPPIFLS